MLTVQELVSQYENLPDEELYAIHQNIQGYSAEAAEALNIVLAKRGGIEKIEALMLEKHDQRVEIARVKKEVAELSVQDMDIDFLKKMVTSSSLSPEALEQAIEEEFTAQEHQREDQKIKPRTLGGSIIGGLLGAIIGGAFWGTLMLATNRVLIFIALVPAIISYFLVKAFTRQSIKNTGVLIATILSTVLGILLGQLVYSIFSTN